MSTKDGHSVSDKAATESCPSNSDAFDLGMSIATPFSNFSTMMMMGHHHRPLPPCATDVVGDGSTKAKSTTLVGDICHVFGGLVGNGGGLRSTDLQPFDIFPTGAVRGEGMAASLGFPFTKAQWMELERQAMIYKYMMASLPVPPHLLLSPNFRNLPPDTGAAASLSLLGSNGLSLRLRNGGVDLEPGRCKRTDGKKWRCSRDAAPDQKYCERHLHRGRPRSRKPVELLPNNNINLNNSTSTNISCKKTCLVNTSIGSECKFPNDKNGTGLQLVETNSSPYLQNCDFLNKPCDKVASFDQESLFGLAYKETRELDWMAKEEKFPVATTDQDQQWHRLASESSFAYQEEPLNLNSFGQVSSQENHQSNIFFDKTPRRWINAWSNTGNTTTSLGLSSNGGNNADNEMGQIQMGLGLNGLDEPASSLWMADYTPGGPLAEVLNLRSTISMTNHSSPVAENGDYGISPAATTVSSPSGVLQKTLVSFSDSSGNSSPRLATSRVNHSEIALLWSDQGRGKLASAE